MYAIAELSWVAAELRAIAAEMRRSGLQQDAARMATMAGLVEGYLDRILPPQVHSSAQNVIPFPGRFTFPDQ
jgi:hypothetical protein